MVICKCFGEATICWITYITPQCICFTVWRAPSASAPTLASFSRGRSTTGTVVIGMLGIVLGFQLLLQAIVLDVGNEPRRDGR